MRRVFFLWLFFCVMNTPLTCAPLLSIVLENKNYIQKLQEFFPDSYLLERLECDKNLMLSDVEMAYLLDISPGLFFTADNLCQGIERIKKKGKLARIDFEMVRGSYGIILKISGERVWTLRALRITGISVGKQRYYPLYEIANGEPFSEEKHFASLATLKRMLIVEGYLNAYVSSYFYYYHSAKALDVHLTVKTGPLFKIHTTSLILYQPDFLDAIEYQNLSLLIKRNFITSLAGKAYTNELLSKRMKAIKKFLEARGLISAHVELQEQICHETGKVTITFFIDLTKGRSFEFFGNHFFSSEYLSRLISHFGQDTSSLPAEILGQEIFAEYQKKGFWNSAIETFTQEQKDFFVIKEGKRIAVAEVTLRGIDNYDPKWFVKKFFSHIVKHSFDVDSIKQALEDLIAWYKNHGFWDAKIIHREYILQDAALYNLNIILEEGQQRFVSSVTIEGYSDIQKEEPFFISKPIPFSAQLLGKQQSALIKKFKSLGFSHVKVKHRLEKLVEGYHIIWSVEPGPYVMFGKTIVRGYTNVPFSIIQKKLAYQEGDVWNKEKLQASLNKLRSLNLFERVSLMPLYNVANPTRRDILLTVQEDDPVEIKLRLGYQQVSKNFAFKKGSSYKIGSSCIIKNPFKKADRLAFDLNFTRFERSISGAYHLPLFFGWPFSTVFKGYATKYAQPVSIGSNKSLYEALQQGFLVGITSSGQLVNRGLNVGFEWMKTKNVSEDLAEALHFKADLIDKKIPYFFIEPSVFVDLLDDKLNPKRGVFALATLKGMFPLESGSSYFVKVLLEEGLFTSLGALTFANRVRFGHIFRKTFSAIMPPERFYLGGANSLRGYQTDKCPPLGTFVDEAGIIQWVAQGGKTMLNMNLEIRFPLVHQPLYGVVFQDFGVLVEDVYSLFKPKKPLAATGFGLRYVTPLGPIRFDIGWKWYKETKEESSYAWFLTFGHAF